MPRIRLLRPILASIRAACAWSRRAWGHVGHRNRHWLFNVVIGLFIEIGLWHFQEVRIVVALQNWALDAAMQGSAAVQAALYGGDLASPPLAFIDIDEETWRNPKWGNGEPLRAPRAGLLALIDYAIKREARYIVLDVIIEGANDPEDAWFAAEIEQRAARLEPGQHILFVRTLREPLSGMQDWLAPEVRPSPLDEVIKRYPEQLHVAAPYFRVSRDGVLRDWQMWRIGCRRDAGAGKGHWEILPSVQLAITALMRSNDTQGAKFPWNLPAGTDSCIVALAAAAQPDVSASEVRPDDALVWNWLRSRPDLTDPIHGSRLAKPNDATIVLSNRIFFRYRYRQERSPVHLIPALAVLKDTPHRNIAANGVVVIGQSFEAARDQHATPLGVMPGPMVLINSLESMLGPGLLHPPSPACDYSAMAIWIAGVGFLLAYTDYAIAVFVSLPFVLLLIFVNYRLLRGGVWMDFAIPLLGMYVHRIVAGFDAYRRRARVGTHVHRKGGD